MKDREAASSRTDSGIVLLHELVEALTALGNYLAVIQQEMERQPTLKQGVLEEAVRKSLSQYGRASEAIRRLQARK